MCFRASGSITACQFSIRARHPVDQEQYRAAARLGVGHRAAVERHRLGLDYHRAALFGLRLGHQLRHLKDLGPVT